MSQQNLIEKVTNSAAVADGNNPTIGEQAGPASPIRHLRRVPTFRVNCMSQRLGETQSQEVNREATDDVVTPEGDGR